MENNNEENFLGVDNEAADAVTDCLRNPVVLRIILEHVSSPELLQLALVNKLWKREARSVMRKRGQFTAYVKSHYLNRNRPEKGPEAFISDLKLMNTIPFSGISSMLMSIIQFSPRFGVFRIQDLDPLQGVVLEQSLLKTISIRLNELWLGNRGSTGVLLAKKLLQDSSGFLEELSLRLDDGREAFMKQVVQDFTFPRLTILKLRDRHCHYGPEEVAYENYMKNLLSRAPNLKVLHSNWSINLMLSILKGSSVLPVYGSRVEAPFEETSEDAVSAIRLENMKLKYTGLGFDFDRLNRITPMLLRASCATILCHIEIDAVLAVPFMCYGIRLENVKTLWMDIDFNLLERVEPRILRVVKKFDFTHIVPNVNKVKMVTFHNLTLDSHDHINRVIDQADTFLGEPMLGRAANVKILYINQRNLSSAAVRFFAEMFPNVENLEITSSPVGNVPIPFGSIWKNWLDLKELEVRGNTLPAAGNLDSVFCGIFPEEIAELKRKSNKYLKKVNIVPVMPALTCMRSLRFLFLNHEHPYFVPLGDDATFIFSKVTTLLAFARLPALAVRLNVVSLGDDDPPAMRHLKPYLSITSDYVEEDWNR